MCDKCETVNYHLRRSERPTQFNQFKPITQNEFLNNCHSNYVKLEPAVNILAPNSTSAVLKKMEQSRRDASVNFSLVHVRLPDNAAE